MIIGVSGGSGTGKSTLTRRLQEILPDAYLINGDIFMHEESIKLENEIMSKIGEPKDPNVFSYNYYLDSFDNVKKWVETIEDNVIAYIKRIIENEKKHNYIIVDWVFLPLCKFFKECDLSICVTCDYDIRLNRLTKRLSDKSIYNEGDRSFWSYKKGILEKRIEYTTLNKYGYFSDYYIDNSKGIPELYDNIEKLVEKMLGGCNNMDLIENVELLDLYTADKKLTGNKIERHTNRDEIPNGEYFLFEQAWILNDKKEILLTQRAFNKKYGGMWEPTSGHVSSGETSLDGIKREINEEIGVKVNDEDLMLVQTTIDKKSIREVWIVKDKNIKIEDLKFKDNEVMNAKFVSLDDFKNMLHSNQTFNNLSYFVDLYNNI